MDSLLQSTRRKIAVADGTLLLLLGLIYAWSVFVAPLETDFGWTRAQTSLVFSIGTAVNTVTGLLAAMLSKKLSPRSILLISAISLFSGFWWASNVHALWELYLAYGVLCCGGIGMAYNQILATIVLWFQDKSGQVSGCIMMCYGIGSMLFGAAATWLIMHCNWRYTFRATGIFCLIILALLSRAVRRPSKQQTVLLPAAPAQIHLPRTVHSKSVLQTIIQDPAFWIFALRNLTFAAIGLTISGHASMIASEVGVSSANSAWFVGAFSVANGISRVLFGVLFDRRGQRHTMYVAVIVALAGSILLTIAFHLQNAEMVFLSFVILGAAFGSAPITSAAFVKDRYGDADYGFNLSCANLSVIIASYAGPFVAGILFQISGYPAVLLSLIGYSLAGFVLTIFLTPHLSHAT